MVECDPRNLSKLHWISLTNGPDPAPIQEQVEKRLWKLPLALETAVELLQEHTFSAFWL